MGRQPPMEDLRNSRRFRLKSYLLHFLFPIRLTICIVLAILSYNYWLNKLEEEQKALDEKPYKSEGEIESSQVKGNLVSTILFALTIFVMNVAGWVGVILRNWSLACAYNAVGIILIMIDVYHSIFDIPFHIFALIVTILILLLNIFLSIDLDEINQQQQRIIRARIEEADRLAAKKPAQLPHQYKSIDLGD